MLTVKNSNMGLLITWEQIKIFQKFQRIFIQQDKNDPPKNIKHCKK
jgi:hypothetical protein